MKQGFHRPLGHSTRKGVRMPVRMRTYVDGKQTRNVVEKRAVYQRANGDYQINWMGGRSDCMVSKAGELEHHMHVRSIRAWSAEDIADRISLKAHTFIVE